VSRTIRVSRDELEQLLSLAEVATAAQGKSHDSVVLTRHPAPCGRMPTMEHMGFDWCWVHRLENLVAKQRAALAAGQAHLQESPE